MNHALILAGGVGQRMRNTGMPKQFLEVLGKPIIVYTLDKFERCADVDSVVIACNAAWIEHMGDLVERYAIRKVVAVVAGGKTRQASVENGVRALQASDAAPDDIVIIHDGVRPLVETNVICENIRIARRYGGAMTVRPVIESVIIAANEIASFDNFKNRDETYSLTSPQTFRLDVLERTIEESKSDSSSLPLLDMALAYTSLGNSIHLVHDSNTNIKITTPEDYYILKAMLELRESKSVFGI